MARTDADAAPTCLGAMYSIATTPPGAAPAIGALTSADPYASQSPRSATGERVRLAHHLRGAEGAPAGGARDFAQTFGTLARRRRRWRLGQKAGHEATHRHDH